MNVGPRGFLNIMHGIIKGAFPNAVFSNATHGVGGGAFTVLLDDEADEQTSYLVTFTRID